MIDTGFIRKFIRNFPLLFHSILCISAAFNSHLNFFRVMNLIHFGDNTWYKLGLSFIIVPRKVFTHGAAYTRGVKLAARKTIFCGPQLDRK